MDYKSNVPSIITGMDIQELVPPDATLFYFFGADYIDPEYLYYARRRGMLSHFDNISNDYVAKVFETHKWDPQNTYLLALGYRGRPDLKARLFDRLDKYDLNYLGTTYDRGLLYKITPKKPAAQPNQTSAKGG
jgi:hypothetical protein